MLEQLRGYVQAKKGDCTLLPQLGWNLYVSHKNQLKMNHGSCVMVWRSSPPPLPPSKMMVGRLDPCFQNVQRWGLER